MTANQLVAHNLRRARERAGLTQEEAAERLEPYLGRRWSKATFSAAETSATSDRLREFTADEILAFARAFDVAVGYFFIPPVEDDLRKRVSSGGKNLAGTAELLELVAPLDVGAVGERINELKKKLPASELRGYEGRLTRMLQETVEAAVQEALDRAIRQMIGDKPLIDPNALARAAALAEPETSPKPLVRGGVVRRRSRPGPKPRRTRKGDSNA
jgi:transcriptional regulator with XRE-family HTH domain